MQNTLLEQNWASPTLLWNISTAALTQIIMAKMGLKHTALVSEW